MLVPLLGIRNFVPPPYNVKVYVPPFPVYDKLFVPQETNKLFVRREHFFMEFLYGLPINVQLFELF